MKRDGFTLIELLVVVAIIGILAAVGGVAYSGYTSAAKKNATEANHKLIVKYIQNEWQRCEIGAKNPLTGKSPSQANIDNFKPARGETNLSCKAQYTGSNKTCMLTTNTGKQDNVNFDLQNKITME